MTERAKFTEPGKRKAQGQLWSRAKNTFGNSINEERELHVVPKEARAGDGAGGQ